MRKTERSRNYLQSCLDQAAKVAVGCGAYHAPGDPAVRGDHERAGQVSDGNDPVELSRDTITGVVQARITEPMVLHIGPATGRVVRDINADEADTRWGELPGGCRQGRCFLLADRAPRSPEVQHYHMPAVRGQTKLPASQRRTGHCGQRWPLPRREDRGPHDRR